jgi:predicted  nucleic acid-binding Zn-ribbon protein
MEKLNINKYLHCIVHLSYPELRSLAYETAVKNKSKIEKLKAETTRLINESISLDNEAVMVELTLRPRQQEINELRKQIETDKNSL